MIKTFSKKFWVTLISVPVIGTGIILACADGGGPEEYGNSSFTPEAFADSSYRPFFYSEYWYYYDIGHDISHDTRFNETNVTEWAGYLNAPHAELEYLLNTAQSSTIDSIAGALNGKIKSLPAQVQHYKLLTKKNFAFINYMQQAKKCEAFAVNNLEYAWDYESKQNKKVTVNTAAIENALMQGYNNSKDAFLKQRYWFQLERSYFFNGSPQTAIDLFEKNEKQFTKNTLYYRTMAYAAGAFYKLKNYSKANYYYSKVYDACAPLKTVTHYSFHPQEESDWKATLALCVNNDEKATLWQMLGVYYADEKRSIQEIYTLNPRNEKLDLLLTRAINKEEQKFTIWDDQLMKEELRFTRDSINQDLLQLVTRIAEAGNTEKPFMWQIAAGYLNMLNGSPQKAATWYASAEKKLPNNQLVQNQLRLLKLVNTIASTKQANSQLENAVLKDIEWLRTMDNNGDAVFRRTGAFEWVKRTMANRYLQQKDYIKSVCFVNYPGFYTNDSHVEAMKSFLDKTNKTPYEQLCANLYIMKKADLLEYQAIRQALHDNLIDAIAKMESSGNNTTLPGNPFNGRLQDCHDCDHEAPQKIKYTKLSLLKKMSDMKAGADVYSNALLLANAYYNITHYGNARAFYECKVIGSSHYSPIAIDSAFQPLLTSMALAAKYYNMALNAAKTDEQKARCQFMLAKCERNEWYNEYKWNTTVDFIAWNGFKTLKQQYANTQYYKEAIRECGYFRTYLNSLH
jgi:hypothetical protein